MSFLTLWFAVALLSGEVRDAVTRAPIAGASIMAVGTSAIAMTDSSGRFRLEAPNGTRIRVVRMGYVSVEFVPQQDSGMRVFLTPVTRALEKVTITAIRGAADASGMNGAAPITQATISARELEQRYSGQEIPLLLSATPGITAYSDGGAYSNYTYFRIRGVDQTRINITLDGIPLNDAEDQGVFFSNFP
ncbi:MAG TPA: carboxypeptidase-like regulatory domain-containing protein, partial [Gemmatimonadaceae bacterium]